MKLFKSMTSGDDNSKASDTAWGWISSQKWPEWTSPTPREISADPGFAEIKYLTAKNASRLVSGECTVTGLAALGTRGITDPLNSENLIKDSY